MAADWKGSSINSSSKFCFIANLPTILSYILILVYIILLAYGSFAHHKIGGWGIETDFYWDYALAAQELQRFEFNVDHYNFRGPGYPLVLAFFDLFIPDTVDAARVVGLLSALTVLLLSYALFRRPFNDLWAAMAVLAVASNPYFIEYTYRFGTDMLFMALCMLFYYLISVSEIKRKAFLIGVTAAFAYLTRYNGIALFIAGLFWVVLSYRRKSSVLKSKLSEFLFGAGILLIPWMALLTIHTGNPFYNLNYQNIAYELFGRGSVVWDDYWYGGTQRETSLFGVIVSHPFTLGWNFLKNVAIHVYKDTNSLLNPIFGLFSLLGIVLVVFRRWRIRSSGWMLFSGLLSYLVLCLVFYSERLSLPLLPVYLLLAVGLLSSGMIPQPSWWKWKADLLLILGFLILLWYAPSNIRSGVKGISDGPIEILEFTAYPTLQDLPKGRMTARKPHAAYYFGQVFAPIPQVKSIDELIEIMIRDKIDYLFLHEVIAFYRPALYGLLSDPNKDERLEPITIRSKKPKCGLWKLR